jgi:hypothetical protein
MVHATLVHATRVFGALRAVHPAARRRAAFLLSLTLLRERSARREQRESGNARQECILLVPH